MANKNSGLQAARKNKADEFYTQLSDIENELRHYTAHFKGKVVYCNCDDPYESNFFKFFVLNFKRLGLKKLITTCYNGSPISGRQLALDAEKIPCGVAHKIEITGVGDINEDGAFNLEDVGNLLLNKNKSAKVVKLKGDGDFKSEECLRLLKEADIVCTNPPFSLFREYVALLHQFNKKFLIIGHQNAITYKGVFSYILGNKMWLGVGFKGGATHFFSFYEDVATAGHHREGMIRVSGVEWFTNLDYPKRHEDLILYENYTEEKYPKYDNYDAINVNKTKDIPCDYYGAMGVPITFLTKFNPEQFEIIGATESEGRGFSNGLWDSSSGIPQAMVAGKKVYKRIFIKRKQSD